MSDLRIVFDGPPGAVSGRFVEVETPDGASVNAGEWHERDDELWELRISMPGADAVVTPQGLEAAGIAACDAWLDHSKKNWRDIARAALEAAGIEVVDEVMEVKNEDGHIQHAAHKDDAEYSYIDLVPGDRVFVKRKED